jgi:hypothetical protein
VGAVGALVFALLFPAYVVKWIRHPAVARNEFADPHSSDIAPHCRSE